MLSHSYSPVVHNPVFFLQIAATRASRKRDEPKSQSSDFEQLGMPLRAQDLGVKPSMDTRIQDKVNHALLIIPSS